MQTAVQEKKRNGTAQDGSGPFRKYKPGSERDINGKIRAALAGAGIESPSPLAFYDGAYTGTLPAILLVRPNGRETPQPEFGCSTVVNLASRSKRDRLADWVITDGKGGFWARRWSQFATAEMQLTGKTAQECLKTLEAAGWTLVPVEGLTSPYRLNGGTRRTVSDGRIEICIRETVRAFGVLSWE